MTWTVQVLDQLDSRTNEFQRPRADSDQNRIKINAQFESYHEFISDFNAKLGYYQGCRRKRIRLQGLRLWRL